MSRHSGSHGADSPLQLRADAVQARENLADTVAELADKADVKARMREKTSRARSRAVDAKEKVRRTAGQSGEQAQGRDTRRTAAVAGAVVAAGTGAAVTAVMLRRQHGHRGHRGKGWW